MLSPILFLIYVYDLLEALGTPTLHRLETGVSNHHFTAAMFFGDLSFVVSGINDKAVRERIKIKTKIMEKWAEQNHVKIKQGIGKSGYMICTAYGCRGYLEFNGKINGPKVDNPPLPTVESITLLGFKFTPSLSGGDQAALTRKRLFERIRAFDMLANTTWGCEMSCLRDLYIAYIRPVMEYAFPLRILSGKAHIANIKVLEAACLRTITGCPYGTRNANMVDMVAILSLQDRRLLRNACYFEALARAKPSESVRMILDAAPQPSVASDSSISLLTTTGAPRQSGRRSSWLEVSAAWATILPVSQDRLVRTHPSDLPPREKARLRVCVVLVATESPEQEDINKNCEGITVYTDGSFYKDVNRGGGGIVLLKKGVL